MDGKLNLDALHCFVIVMKNNGNVTLAAKELRISQPSVSHCMKVLQEKYGELFVRDARGAHFVGVGKILHDSAEHAVAELENTQRRIKAIRKASAASERLIVGYSPSHVGAVMSIIATLLDSRGGLAVLTEEADPETLARRLHQSDGPEIGIGYFTPADRNGLEGPEVSPKPLGLVFNKTKREHLAKLERVSLSELEDEPLALLQKGPVRKNINRFFGRQKPQRVVLESNMMTSLLAAARVGFASTILAGFEEDATFGVCELHPRTAQPTFMLWNARLKRSAAAMAFAEAVLPTTT